MQVPLSAWIAGIIVTVFVIWISIWVTNKAYSRRWEDEDDEKKGQVQPMRSPLQNIKNVLRSTRLQDIFVPCFALFQHLRHEKIVTHAIFSPLTQLSFASHTTFRARVQFQVLLCNQRSLFSGARPTLSAIMQSAFAFFSPNLLLSLNQLHFSTQNEKKAVLSPFLLHFCIFNLSYMMVRTLRQEKIASHAAIALQPNQKEKEHNCL